MCAAPVALRPDAPGAAGGMPCAFWEVLQPRAASTRSSGEGVSNAKAATPFAGGTGGAMGYCASAGEGGFFFPAQTGAL